MEKRNKLLAMLLALTMVLAYMPAMAFAEGDESADVDGESAVEETAETVEDAAGESFLESLSGKSLKKEAVQYEEVTDSEIYDIEMSVSRTDVELLKYELYDPEDDTWNYPVYFKDGDKLRVYTSDTEYDEYQYVGDSASGDGFVFENSKGDTFVVHTWWCSYYDTERIHAGETYEFDAEYDSMYGAVEFVI